MPTSGMEDRDADGRRFWEASDKKMTEESTDQNESPRQAKDPTGSSGNSLDLTG